MRNQEITKDNQKMVAELLERVQNMGIEEYKEILNSMATFHNYSYSNQIILHFSGASQVAGFLNSEGGQLIIGVEDNGNVFGLEKDYVAISNGDRDKFENHLVQLTKTAIGVEFLKYIRFSFDSIDSKDVCLVTVVRGNKPAYVTFKGNEEFFVRTGNNTSPLGMKETQDYISDNWD